MDWFFSWSLNLPKVWSVLPDTGKFIVFASIPFLLLHISILIKTGFGLPTATAGGDFCMAAIALDFSQLLLFINLGNQIPTNFKFADLLVILLVIHLWIWICALRMVASISKLNIFFSQFIGGIAVFTAYMPILYRIIP